VSALEALAQLASSRCPAGSLVAAWIDAFRGEVFSALYRVVDGALFSSARLLELDPPQASAPSQILDGWRTRFGPVTIWAGEGAALYSSTLPAGADVMVPPALAGAIGAMAAVRALAGKAVSPAAVQPLYVRRPDAEVARERREAETKATAKPRG